MRSLWSTGFALLALSTASACGDDDAATPDAAPAAPDAAVATPDAVPVGPDAGPQEVTLHFEPRVLDAPFACGQSYPDMGAEATTITPRDFRMYVHDVELLRDDGSHVPLELTQDGTWQYQNLVLLDFEDFTGGCQDGTPETNNVIRGTAPAGTYTGVAFDIGVPEALNHANLIDVPAPLNLTGLWWGWNFGHIFLAVVSHADITTPEPGTNDHYIHVGSIDCEGDPEMGTPVTCGRPNRPHVELDGFDPTTGTIIADFGAVLAKSKLATSQGCHSFDEEPCAYPFDFVGLNWFTGSVTPTTQKLFRIKTP